MRILKKEIYPSGTLPRVCRAQLSCPHMPSGLVGRKIAFVTDIHYGSWLGDRAMARIIALIMEQEPHLIILGGDLAEGLKAQKRLMERHLSCLKAPLGVVAVPGNNDCEALKGDYRLWRQMLEDAGVRLLLNQRAIFPGEGGRLVVSGLDESKYGSPDPGTAAQPLQEGDLHLLVTHSPWALARVLDKAARVDMALCGHTHGGQFALGKRGAYLAMGYRKAKDRPYFFLSGDRVLHGRRILVSNGIGCSLLPLRFGVEPQIHMIELS